MPVPSFGPDPASQQAAPQGSTSQPPLPVLHNSELGSATAQHARVWAGPIRADVGLLGVQWGSGQDARVAPIVKQGGKFVDISKLQLVTRPGTKAPATSGGPCCAVCRSLHHEHEVHSCYFISWGTVVTLPVKHAQSVRLRVMFRRE